MNILDMTSKLKDKKDLEEKLKLLEVESTDLVNQMLQDLRFHLDFYLSLLGSAIVGEEIQNYQAVVTMDNNGAKVTVVPRGQTVDINNSDT